MVCTTSTNGCPLDLRRDGWNIGTPQAVIRVFGPSQMPTSSKARSKAGVKGFRKRTPSRKPPSTKSSLRTNGTWLSLAVAQMRASQMDRLCSPAPFEDSRCRQIENAAAAHEALHLGLGHL